MTKFAKELYEEYTVTTREAREDMLDDLHDALGEMIQENERLRAAKAKLDDALTTVLYDLQHAGIELAPDVLKQAEEALDE